MSKFVGIDYSLTGPAIAVYDDSDGDFCFENCSFFFMTSVKKNEGWLMENVQGTLFPDYKCHEERYNNITKWALKSMTHDEEPDHVAIEGYSMGSKGKVFNLAENCGILKHSMWLLWFDEDKASFDVYAPTEVKKYATGKGNAKKDAMYDSFVEETGINLMSELTPNKTKIDSPVGDIVDAFFILKKLVDERG